MSETSEKVIDKIIDNATSRLRIPIVSTYIIVLLVHNWDLVYYLLFQSGEATTKIAYIKKNYPNYWGGIFEAVGIAICVLITVSLLDFGLSWLLQIVYKERKKISDKINNYKTFEDISTSLAIQINEVVALREHLNNEKEKNSNQSELIKEYKENIINYEENINKSSIYLQYGLLINKISLIDENEITLSHTLFIDIIYNINNLLSKGQNEFKIGELILPKKPIELTLIRKICNLLEIENYIIAIKRNDFSVTYETLNEFNDILKVMNYIKPPQ